MKNKRHVPRANKFALLGASLLLCSSLALSAMKRTGPPRPSGPPAAGSSSSAGQAATQDDSDRLVSLTALQSSSNADVSKLARDIAAGTLKRYQLEEMLAKNPEFFSVALAAANSIGLAAPREEKQEEEKPRESSGKLDYDKLVTLWKEYKPIADKMAIDEGEPAFRQDSAVTQRVRYKIKGDYKQKSGGSEIPPILLDALAKALTQEAPPPPPETAEPHGASTSSTSTAPSAATGAPPPPPPPPGAPPPPPPPPGAPPPPPPPPGAPPPPPPPTAGRGALLGQIAGRPAAGKTPRGDWSDEAGLTEEERDFRNSYTGSKVGMTVKKALEAKFPTTDYTLPWVMDFIETFPAEEAAAETTAPQKPATSGAPTNTAPSQEAKANSANVVGSISGGRATQNKKAFEKRAQGGAFDLSDEKRAGLKAFLDANDARWSRGSANELVDAYDNFTKWETRAAGDPTFAAFWGKKKNTPAAYDGDLDKDFAKEQELRRYQQEHPELAGKSLQEVQDAKNQEEAALKKQQETLRNQVFDTLERLLPKTAQQPTRSGIAAASSGVSQNDELAEKLKRRKELERTREEMTRMRALQEAADSGDVTPRSGSPDSTASSSSSNSTSSTSTTLARPPAPLLPLPLVTQPTTTAPSGPAGLKPPSSTPPPSSVRTTSPVQPQLSKSMSSADEEVAPIDPTTLAARAMLRLGAEDIDTFAGLFAENSAQPVLGRLSKDRIELLKIIDGDAALDDQPVLAELRGLKHAMEGNKAVVDLDDPDAVNAAFNKWINPWLEGDEAQPGLHSLELPFESTGTLYHYALSLQEPTIDDFMAALDLIVSEDEMLADGANTVDKAIAAESLVEWWKTNPTLQELRRLGQAKDGDDDDDDE